MARKAIKTGVMVEDSAGQGTISSDHDGGEHLAQNDVKIRVEIVSKAEVKRLGGGSTSSSSPDCAVSSSSASESSGSSEEDHHPSSRTTTTTILKTTAAKCEDVAKLLNAVHLLLQRAKVLQEGSNSSGGGSARGSTGGGEPTGSSPAPDDGVYELLAAHCLPYVLALVKQEAPAATLSPSDPGTSSVVVHLDILRMLDGLSALGLFRRKPHELKDVMALLEKRLVVEMINSRKMRTPISSTSTPTDAGRNKPDVLLRRSQSADDFQVLEDPDEGAVLGEELERGGPRVDAGAEKAFACGVVGSRDAASTSAAWSSASQGRSCGGGGGGHDGKGRADDDGGRSGTGEEDVAAVGQFGEPRSGEAAEPSATRRNVLDPPLRWRYIEYFRRAGYDMNNDDIMLLLEE